jgi:hypothetical protein
MAVNDVHYQIDEFAFEHALSNDARVREEFDQLNRFLNDIHHLPVDVTPTQSDPAWRIEDHEVCRWRIVVQGNTRLERIVRFRSELKRRDDIIDVRVERSGDGEIAIHLETTGGIPMGPLERAVWTLTRCDDPVTPAD